MFTFENSGHDPLFFINDKPVYTTFSSQAPLWVGCINWARDGRAMIEHRIDYRIRRLGVNFQGWPDCCGVKEIQGVTDLHGFTDWTHLTHSTDLTRSTDLIALEIIWQPEGEGDVLSSEELVTTYPNLKHL